MANQNGLMRVDPADVARRWSLMSVGSAVLVAVAVSATWVLGRWGLLAFGSSYVPMAPVTALLVFLLGGAITLRTRNGARGSTLVATALAGMAAALAAGVLLGALLDTPLPVEERLSSTNEEVGGIRVGRTSAYTAAIALVLAAGLLWRSPGRGRRRLEVSAALTVILTCVLILQGYLFGGPLFYGTGTIPVAAATAVCFLLLGIGFLFTVGPDLWPARLLLPGTPSSEAPSPWAFRMLTVSVAGMVLVSAALWVSGEQRRADQRTLETLTAIAELEADEIAAWYAGHRSLARAVQSLPPLLTGEASGPDGNARLRAWMDTLREDNDYAAVAWLDPDGEVRAVTPPGHPMDSTLVRAQLSALQAAPQIRFEDLHREGDELVFKVWIPVAADDASRPPAGWLLLEIDAVASFFPLMHDVPLPTATTEVLLWRAEGDSAVVLNDTRLGQSPGLTLRVPLDGEGAPAGARAVMGDLGPLDGTDYRGVEVAAVARPVTGTPWTLVAKMDRSEIQAPIVRAAVAASVISLLLLMGAMTAVYALWSRRELALLQDREAALEARREMEGRYARAMRNMVDGSWEWDIPNGLVYLSPSWRRRHGLGEEDPSDIQTSFFDRVHSLDRPRVEEALKRHFEDGAPYDIEFRMRDAEGRYHWYWARGEAERSASGKPMRMSGGITDVTARKEAEEELQRTDRILRLRSACNLALVRADDEEALLRGVCDAAVREGGYLMAWVGYPEDDEARSVTPVVVSGHEDGYLSEVKVSWNPDEPLGNGPTGRCIRSGEAHAAQNISQEVDYEPWRDAARARGFESSCAIPLRVGDVTVAALMLYSHETDAFDEDEMRLLSEVGSDVSFGIRAKRDAVAVEKHQAELALFRQAIDGSSDAFFVADTETGLFVDFNESAARQVGYTREELLTMGPPDIAPHLRDPETWAGVLQAARRGESIVRRSIHVRKDGSELPVEISFSTVEDRGRTLVLAISRDISEREAADRESEALRHQLEQAQKMESVGRLAGGVAHDFNNLLTVVNATTDLALADLAPDAPLRPELEEIRGAGERAARLTRQLLAFSRRQVMHPRHIQVNEVVREFLDMIRRVIGEQVVLEAVLADDLPLIEGDTGQLEQVLMNLCVNARDAMPTGGTLTISTRCVDLSEEDAARHVAMSPGEHVLLSVTDTGEGMDEDTQARIFEPFFTTKDRSRGTGLGLSTVYGIVKQSGGSVWVYSEIGLGTTFKIYFPTARSRDREEGTRVAAPTGSETILVVEDEEPIRRLVRRILDRAGYSVVEAANGTEALEILERRGPEIQMVLTDLVVPGMSGTQLAARVTEAHPDLRILLATGYSADALASRLPRERKWNIIGKPYAVEELLHAVRLTLDG